MYIYTSPGIKGFAYRNIHLNNMEVIYLSTSVIWNTATNIEKAYM